MNPIQLVFAINHMAAPRLDLDAFLAQAARLDCRAVEIRNDLPGRPVLDGTPPQKVRDLTAARGLRILSINALQRFNDWGPDREAEAVALAEYARDCGAEALVLVPSNDGSGCEDGLRQRALRQALRGLAPILGDAGLIGLVEPLGFASCALRRKSEAVAAITDLDLAKCFRLVHDTFHHHLAGESDLFAGATGLIHVSGVTDPGLAIADMRDEHRVLVDSADRLDNLGQIAGLLRAGATAPLSFEPFAASVHDLTDPAAAIGASMAFIRAGLNQKS